MNKGFRKLALELHTLDSRNVVKVAGVMRRLQNWFKKQFNPEYKATLNKIQNETSNFKTEVENLSKLIIQLQSAIKDGEVEEYNIYLASVKDALSVFWNKLEVTQDKVKDWYDLQRYNEPGFKEWFQENMPKEYDLELNKQLDIPFQQSNWHQRFSPNEIVLTAPVEKTLFSKIIQTIKRIKPDLNIEEYILLHSEEILSSFKQGILQGQIVEVIPKKPDNNQAHPQIGMTVINLTTSFFDIGLGYKAQCKVLLNDLSTTKNSRTKLAVMRISHLVVSGSKNASIKLAFQTAEEPYTPTTLSDTELADTLRKGYQQAFGSDPTVEALAGGWAQATFESGRPVKLPNNNIGNIKATSSWINSGNHFFVKSTKENTAKGKEYIEHGTKWRAYNSPVEGAVGYWKFLGHGYPDSLSWMAAGDPKSATVSLGTNHYFTGNIKQYSTGVNSLYQEFINKIAPNMQGLKSDPQPSPGPKPDVKAWSSDYTANTTQDNLTQDNSNKDNSSPDVDSLLNTLLASPLSNLVKCSMIKQSFPLIIQLQGKDSENQLEYGKILSNLLRKYLKASVVIKQDKFDQILLQCQIFGNPLYTTSEIQNHCNKLSKTMKDKVGYTVEGIVILGMISPDPEITQEAIEQNHRIFQIKRLEC